MNWRERLKLKNLVLRKTQNCEKCGEEFSCEIGLKGCWCSQIKLSKETLQNLRKTYKKCLCRACLEEIAGQPPPPEQ